MKLLFVFVLLLTLNSQAANETTCKTPGYNLEKDFKYDPKDTDKTSPLVMDRADYKKMKNLISEIPPADAANEKYKKSILDGVDNSTDIVNEMQVWREACVFKEYMTVSALEKYVQSNLKDKNLLKDFEDFVKARVTKQLNSPKLIILVIRLSILRSVEQIKNGKESPLDKEMGNLSKKMNAENKELTAGITKLNLPQDLEPDKFTPEQSKLIVPFFKKEIEKSEEYSKKIAEFIPKI